MNATQWFQGLLASVIAGGATAGGSWLAINAAGAAGAAVPVLNWKALGIILLVGAGTNLFSYLKQSPIPTVIERTEKTQTVVTKQITETPSEDSSK